MKKFLKDNFFGLIAVPFILYGLYLVLVENSVIGAIIITFSSFLVIQQEIIDLHSFVRKSNALNFRINQMFWKFLNRGKNDQN